MTDLVSREAVIRAIRRRFDARKPVPTGSASRDKINRDFAHECYTACVEAIEALPSQPSAAADPDLHAALEMSPCYCKGNFVCARCGALRLARIAQPSAVEDAAVALANYITMGLRDGSTLGGLAQAYTDARLTAKAAGGSDG